MGRKGRIRQERLAEKLLQIRLTLGLSQTELLKHLGVEDLIVYNQISRYESGSHEPPLRILLSYARVAGICLDMLVDDEVDLPTRLPAKPKHTHRR